MSRAKSSTPRGSAPLGRSAHCGSDAAHCGAAPLPVHRHTVQHTARSIRCGAMVCSWYGAKAYEGGYEGHGLGRVARGAGHDSGGFGGARGSAARRRQFLVGDAFATDREAPGPRTPSESRGRARAGAPASPRAGDEPPRRRPVEEKDSLAFDLLLRIRHPSTARFRRGGEDWGGGPPGGDDGAGARANLSGSEWSREILRQILWQSSRRSPFRGAFEPPGRSSRRTRRGSPSTGGPR